ncbi:hypothetical protein Csa_014292 [Cucumis sativus]|nr:hypothetical protein Csa_014292 [Cucumis sativus]
MKSSVLLFSFTFLFFHPHLCFADDAHDEFKACGVNYNCGELVNISYPFWGNERQSFCGRRQFRLTCKDNETTTIQIHSRQYIVVNISQSDHRMTIARSELFDDYCPNNEIEAATLDFSLFKYSSNDLNLSVWYDCPVLPGTQNLSFECGSEGEKSGRMNYALDNIEAVSLSPLSVGCRIKVEVTITSKLFKEGKRNRTMVVERGMKEGFEVEYGDFYTVACEGYQKFEACAPKSCGNGPNISYPFWIAHSHSPFCGFPSFRISCKDENPIIRISNEDYIIRDISYKNHSFLLTNDAVYDSNCLTPLHNFSLHRTPFSYSSDHIGFFFFYNCTSLPPNYSYPIDCSSTSKLHSFGAFHEGYLEFMNFSSNSCQSSVEVPMDFNNEDDDFTGLLRKNYTDLLKMGFSLNWSGQSCSTCDTSGGRCGVEKNQFVCFCPDGPHLKTCKEGQDTKWKKTVIGVCSGIGGVLLMGVASFIWFCLHKKKLARSYTPSSFLLRNNSSEPSTKELEKGENDMGLPLFSYEELEKATDRFNPAKELGDGGFGTVYYGKDHSF